MQLNPGPTYESLMSIYVENVHFSLNLSVHYRVKIILTETCYQSRSIGTIYLFFDVVYYVCINTKHWFCDLLLPETTSRRGGGRSSQ